MRFLFCELLISFLPGFLSVAFLSDAKADLMSFLLVFLDVETHVVAHAVLEGGSVDNVLEVEFWGVGLFGFGVVAVDE